MSTETASLYIGSDNSTGRTDMAAIDNILGKRHPEGYTVLTGYGCYHGTYEDCAVAVVTGTRDYITATAALLRTELAQDSIGVQFTAPITFL